jgi:hypothetical protein
VEDVLVGCRVSQRDEDWTGFVDMDVDARMWSGEDMIERCLVLKLR